jgi:hypothetical protein
MQRPDAKIDQRNGKRPSETNERKDTVGNPHRNGPPGVQTGISGFLGLGGGRTRARTWDPMIKSLTLMTLFQRLSCKSGGFETQ